MNIIALLIGQRLSLLYHLFISLHITLGVVSTQKKPVDGLVASPYPSLTTMVAPVASDHGHGLDDAAATLRRVQQSRQYLEANLDAMLKAKQEGAIYSFIDEINRDRYI